MPVRCSAVHVRFAIRRLTASTLVIAIAAISAKPTIPTYDATLSDDTKPSGSNAKNPISPARWNACDVANPRPIHLRRASSALLPGDGHSWTAGRATYASANSTADVRAVHRTTASEPVTPSGAVATIAPHIAAIASAISPTSRGPDTAASYSGFRVFRVPVPVPYSVFSGQ